MGREKELYEEVRTITEPIGLVIVDLAIKERREGTNIYLVIHKDTGVTIQDCERVSKFLNDRLSVLGNVWGRKDYSLQVSSPGLYREFKNKREYNIFRSRQVKIILKKPYEFKPVTRDVLSMKHTGKFPSIAVGRNVLHL
jgi:ribosome maturation factor RimP